MHIPYYNLPKYFTNIQFFFFFQNSFGVLCSIFVNLILALSGYDSMSSKIDEKCNHSVFPLALATFSKKSSQVGYNIVRCLIIISKFFNFSILSLLRLSNG